MKFKIFILFFILVFITSCNKQENQKNSEKFSGFTAVGANKENPLFYFDKNTAKQALDGTIAFNMIKVLPDGYVIQNAQTDCKNSFNSFEGVKFRNDGTSQEKFAAEYIAPSFNAQINGLVTTVCSTGNYQSNDVLLADDALKQLFGKTNANKRIETAKDISSIWFEQAFQYKDDSLHVVFIKTQEIDNTCNVCGVGISAIIYKKSDNAWQIVSKQLKITDIGSYGDAPEVTQATVLSIPSSNKSIFLIDYIDVDREAKYIGQYLFLFSDDKWQYSGHILTGMSNNVCSVRLDDKKDIAECQSEICGEDNKKCWSSEGKISLISSNKEYPDFLITKTGTEIDDKGNIVPAKNVTYSFDGKEYLSETAFLEKQKADNLQQAVPISQNTTISEPSEQTAPKNQTWTSGWGNDINAIVSDKPCINSELKNQGYDYLMTVSIPTIRLKNSVDAWQVSGDRAITIIGCWTKRDDNMIHANLTRKKGNKNWEQDFKLDDGNWTKQ